MLHFRHAIKVCVTMVLAILVECLLSDLAGAALPNAVVVWGTSLVTTAPEDAHNDVAAISAGGNHGMVLRADGRVVAWGWNIFGQTNVPLAARTNVVAISAGGGHCLALMSDGRVLAWGAGTNNVQINERWGQSIVPSSAETGVMAISAGYYHSVALKNDGSVLVWGRQIEGETNVPPSGMSNVVAIAAGGFHTLALKSDGSVVAWGAGLSNGPLPFPPYEAYGQSLVPEAAGSEVVAIAGGNTHSVVLKADGSLVAWGDNRYGQTSIPLAAQGDVAAITAGHFHTMALKRDGRIIAWGATNMGGLPNYGQGNVPASAQFGATQISAGEFLSMALITPALKVVKTSSNETLLQWSTNFAGFGLQTLQSFSMPADWTDITNPPGVVDGLWTLTNSTSSEEKYFRLRK